MKVGLYGFWRQHTPQVKTQMALILGYVMWPRAGKDWDASSPATWTM